MAEFRKDATPQMKERYQGMIETVWSDASYFLKEREAIKAGKKIKGFSQWDCFDKMFKRMNELAAGK